MIKALRSQLTYYFYIFFFTFHPLATIFKKIITLALKYNYKLE